MISSAETGLHLSREVRFGDAHYDFYVSNGSWDELLRRLGEMDADRFFIVADRGLPEATIEEVESRVGTVAPTLLVTLAAEESSKRLATIDDLADRALIGGVTRKSCVIAMGGGVVGNMAGLLAGLLFRGIRLVHLPTTLLGMSDSVLSMKQAVNSKHAKNTLGLFAAPAFVWCRLEFLDSLPAEEVQAAMCETIKNVLAICPDRYDQVAAKLRPDGRYRAEEIVDFIELCIDAKSKVMRNDPHEKRDALILEYGHTVGHAVELLSGGRIRHGFAVGIGMVIAAQISNRLGYLDASDAAAHHALLVRNGAPTTLPPDIAIDDIMRTIRLDNKRGYLRPRPEVCDMILLDRLGAPHRTQDSLISQVDTQLVRAGIAAAIGSH